MVWLAALLMLFLTVLWVYAFFDTLTSPGDEVRNLPKALWLVVIVILPPVGALLWFLFGRPRVEAVANTASVQTGSVDELDPSDFSRPTSHNGPVGPDDDPEFLRKLNRRINPDD